MAYLACFVDGIRTRFASRARRSSTDLVIQLRKNRFTNLQIPKGWGHYDIINDQINKIISSFMEAKISFHRQRMLTSPLRLFLHLLFFKTRMASHIASMLYSMELLDI